MLPKIESSQGLHDPEVSREAVLVQVVVGQVKDFQDRKRPEAAGQRRQPVHGQVQNPGNQSRMRLEVFGQLSLCSD